MKSRLNCFSLATVAILMIPTIALAQRFDVVKNLNTDTAESNPFVLGELNGEIFFIGYEQGTGRELRKTDGTSEGTELVRDISVGVSTANIFVSATNNAVVGDYLYFYVSSYWDGTGLDYSTVWRTDGTEAGTIELTTDSIVADFFVDAGDGLAMWAGIAPSQGYELWISDGTPEGTESVDLEEGPVGSNPRYMTVFESEVYLQAFGELYKSDGTVAGTTLVADINPTGSSGPLNFSEFEGELYFSAYTTTDGYELWKSDGTESGTEQVADINPGTSSSNPGQFVEHQGVLYFVATTAAEGLELWQTDGTESGTTLVADIASGTNSSDPRFLTSSGSYLFFNATDGDSGRELWRTDSSASGAVLVKDIAPGLASGVSSVLNMAALDGSVVFPAWDGEESELWISDGTLAGTEMLKDIHPTDSGNPRNLLSFQDSVWFTATEPVHQREFWKTDGTEVGTELAVDANARTLAGAWGPAVEMGGDVYFSGSDGDGCGLVKSDGTTGGTEFLRVLRENAGFNSIYDLTTVGSRVVFSAWIVSLGVDSGIEVCSSDGTANETGAVTDLANGIGHGAGDYVGTLGDEAFYEGYASNASGTLYGSELYRTDGEYLYLVKDINPGTGSSSPGPGILFGDYLYFAADDGTDGRELWRTDGTSAGTTLVADIHTTGSSNPGNFCIAGGVLYFTANDGSDGVELWKTNGTGSGTKQVADIRPGSFGSFPVELTEFDGEVICRASDGIDGYELWKTDGTVSGTVQLGDIEAGVGSSFPTNFVEYDGSLYFRAFTSADGYELYKTNGTAFGTVLVKDIAVGELGSAPRGLFVHKGELYFAAYTLEEGIELWKSNGTSTGTVLVADHDPGTSSANPQHLFEYDNELYLFASGPEGESELCHVPQFVRGDANGDGVVNGTLDAIYLLDTLIGGPQLPCDDAGDVNDDGVLFPLTDAFYLLVYSYLSGPAPQAPFSSCGLDETSDDLRCQSSACP